MPTFRPACGFVVDAQRASINEQNMSSFFFSQLPLSDTKSKVIRIGYEIFFWFKHYRRTFWNIQKKTCSNLKWNSNDDTVSTLHRFFVHRIKTDRNSYVFFKAYGAVIVVYSLVFLPTTFFYHHRYMLTLPHVDVRWCVRVRALGNQ